MSSAFAGNKCPDMQSVKKQIDTVFKKPAMIEAVYPIGIDGFCRVITKYNGNFFIDTNSRYLIKGMIFKLPDRKVDSRFIKFLNKSVSFEAGNGKNYVFVIVDPDCEACRNSSKKMKLFFDNGIKLKFILAPFSSKEAEEKAVKFICKKGNISDYMEGNFNGKVCTTGKLNIWSVMDKLKSRGLVSTPIFITPAGKVLSGEDSVEKVIDESIRGRGEQSP